MANPQLEEGYTRLANSIIEAIMLRQFSKRQRNILDMIFRFSYGCNKKSATIPRQRDFAIVGVTEGHVKAELDYLTAIRVISINGDVYSFNKDFDQWQISLVKPYEPHKLTELVRLNLDGTYQKGKSNLPKREESTYQKGKLAEPELASAKDILKTYKDNIAVVLPEGVDRETWDAFLEMRKKKRAPNTDSAISLLVKKLGRLREDGENPNDILEQSIMRGYTGLFSLKGGNDARSAMPQRTYKDVTGDGQ